ncbi:MAG: DegT/DnrJ/EryC1/StrS family aminotransferase [Candidatus Melainabacteria bacterium]|nr:DegT/DnrJ/EryC1/StrS family aminotransferase [Candidatus Melainabacteria bacterium]
MKVPFFVHSLGKEELDSVAEVLSGPILTTGVQVARFEHSFATLLGCRHAIAVTSCTGALHMSLLALGIGPGDEVITTPMTFIATATAILETGARPVFVDVEPETGNLNASLIEKAITQRTRAILPVHLYGHMCDMYAIKEIADRHGLYLIEDAAHCLEGERDGVRPGQLSSAACFSFYATKSLTSGEGGAIVTNDDSLADKLRLLRLHGMTKSLAERHQEGYTHWDMTMLGWKYNMDNIQAALLLPQLKRIEDNWRKRESLAYYYQERLSGIKGLAWPICLPNVRHARHIFSIWTDSQLRDSVVSDLQNSGIGVVVNYRAIHLLSYFRQTFGFQNDDFPAAEQIGHTTLSLPCYPGMPEEHVNFVTERLRHFLLEEKHI